MINHARTLLINKAYTGRTGLPGDEYVPPAYVALTLPSCVQKLRQQIFGTDPDDVMLNFRSWQLLSLIHSCELKEFITDLDTRVTYQTGVNSGFFDSFFSYVARGSGSATLTLLGSAGAPDYTGRCYDQWKVTVVNGTTATVARQAAPVSSENVTIVPSNGLSQVISLPSSGLSCRFAVTVGAYWDIFGYSRPQRELGEIAASLSSVGSETFLDLFGVGSGLNQSEPFKTFYSLWNDNDELPYKLGGLILAMIYRTEAVRIAS